MKGLQVGLVIDYEVTLQYTFLHEVFNMGIVLEEKVVLHNFTSVPCSFAMLM